MPKSVPEDGLTARTKLAQLSVRGARLSLVFLLSLSVLALAVFWFEVVNHAPFPGSDGSDTLHFRLPLGPLMSYIACGVFAMQVVTRAQLPGKMKEWAVQVPILGMMFVMCVAYFIVTIWS